MKTQRVHKIMQYHVQTVSRTNNNLEAGYLWFFLATGLVMGFMILSHMGIAS